jgi:hypothetical protein
MVPGGPATMTSSSTAGAPAAAGGKRLRDREGGAEETVRSGDVEGESSWDGEGS